MTDWNTAPGGAHFWEPAPDIRYECLRVSPRSRKYWARRNGIYLGTRQIRVFMGSLERCKELCREHHDEARPRAEPVRRRR